MITYLIFALSSALFLLASIFVSTLKAMEYLESRSALTVFKGMAIASTLSLAIILPVTYVLSILLIPSIYKYYNGDKFLIILLLFFSLICILAPVGYVFMHNVLREKQPEN